MAIARFSVCARRAVVLAALISCATPPRAAAPKVASTPAVAPRRGVEVTLLDRGAEPRHVVQYPRTGFAHAVTLTWRGSAQLAQGPRAEWEEFLERTLEGSLINPPSGPARIEFRTGTSQLIGNTTSNNKRVAAKLETELPASFNVVLDSQRFDVAPLANPDREQDALYRLSLLAALPSALPAEPIGRGARWQIVSRTGDATATWTWEVAAIEGSALTLIGTSRQLVPSDRSLRTTLNTSARATIDFRSFSLTATIERDEASWSRARSTSQRHESATLTIGGA